MERKQSRRGGKDTKLGRWVGVKEKGERKIKKKIGRNEKRGGGEEKVVDKGGHEE